MLPLMTHQEEDVDWWEQVQRGLLGNEPGLGKSRSAIEGTKGMKTLVVAPAMILAAGVWDTEIEKWAEDPSCYTFAAYTGLNARKAVDKQYKAADGTTATKKVSKLQPVVRPELKGPWDAVILDEAHYIKGRRTLWTDVAQKIAKNSGKVVLMTGTPIPNWSFELFTSLQIIFPNEAKPGGKYGSFWRWAGEWFDTSPSRFSQGRPSMGEMLDCTPQCLRRPPKEPCDHYLRFARENLGHHYRRVWRSTVLDLPPVIEQTVATPMTATQSKIYKQLSRDFITEHEGKRLIAWNQGSLNVMLDKVTTSHTLLTGRTYHQSEVMGTKLEQLKADLTQRSRATLVLAHYQDTVEACHEVALEVGLRSARVHGGVGTRAAGAAIQSFRNGELDVLVGSLETVAEGHTLTVADMAIFVEQSWKAYRNEQALHRVHRMGQTRPVTIRRYITPGTVDERKEGIVASKSDEQIRTMTAAEFAALL